MTRTAFGSEVDGDSGPTTRGRWCFPILGAIALLLCVELEAAAECVSVRQVLDGDTMELAQPIDGATTLRLATIEAVKPPLDLPADTPWPLADTARAALAELTAQGCLDLALQGRYLDRHRRIVAQATRDDGLWLQGELVRRGLARVRTAPDNRSQVGELLALEEEARRARRRLWAEAYYRVRSADESDPGVGGFRIVEGTVRRASRVENRVYVNFGDDWRSDFTVTVPTKALADFRAVGLDPLTLGGRRIRVRGVVEAIHGPAIEATHPQQIEVLADPAP
jgi:endonuclease YncB( thermonuclease family)